MALSPDLEPFRRAVQLRDRCREAAMARAREQAVPLSFAQANIAFDAMVGLIFQDARRQIREGRDG